MGNLLSDANCKSNVDKVIAEQEATEREMGQQALRQLAMSPNGETDWGAIIRKAEELHKRDQSLVHQRQQRKQILLEEQKRRKKELARRKKEDAAGSFSVNLITYKAEDTTESLHSDTRSISSPHHGWASSGEQSVACTTENSTWDHSSKASDTISECHYSRSCDEGMIPIDENSCL
mmetsp:Transcript_18697/g.27068  ORF Transcript_18697/g.27068 Transcript_18697/m.27068 type:complete len:177 (-) Transcript_18697:74-604(-)